MFQDYQSKVVKTISDFSGLSLVTTVSGFITSNKAQRYVTGGDRGVSRQVLFDTTNTNVIMSFDGSVMCSEGNDFVAFVHTYAASTALDGDIAMPTNDVALFPFFSIQGCGYFQGNVAIPKLQLADGESQYVLVGVASNKPKTEVVSMALDMKLHLQDSQVFQPSK